MEYTNRITKETQGIEPGTAMEEVFSTDPNWYRSDIPRDEIPARSVEPAPKTLGERKIGELRDIAAERGIDLEGATKKVDIIAKIEAGPGQSTPNPADLAPTPDSLTDEQLDEVVDLVEDLDIDEQATREVVLEAIREHADQAEVLEAIKTVVADD